MDMTDGYELVLRAAMEAARPDPELRIDKWAEEFMELPKSAAHPGKYRFERTPYARRVHEVLSPGHPCRRVVAKVASQMFKTQTAINAIGAWIHKAPANILALQPTDGLAKRFSARISQAIRMVPELRECVSQQKSRDKRNTTQAKDFKGDATLYINTAGAAANLAEITVRYLFIDEVDRLPPLPEGDSVAIAEARATQHERDCKFYEVSSPTETGLSKIDELFMRGTQEVYLVPCPHAACGHHHELVLKNFKYRRDDVTGFMDRAWFVCPSCGADIEEHHKTVMFLDEAEGGTAHWKAMASGDGETVSFTLSAFYMPVGAITWLRLAREYDYAKKALLRGDHTKMQAFVNTRLGLSYSNQESTTTAKELQDRAEKYPARVVPHQALVVTMAVDTQPNRLEAQIVAWGPDMESWVIDYITLIGSPTVPPSVPGSVWQQLNEIRRTPWLHESGRPILMSAYGIDAGGANTQDVYNYGSTHKQYGCTVIAGATRPGKPIISSAPSKVDIDWGGVRLPGGVERWEIGTDVAKDYLSDRMHLTGGPGAMHFHEQLPPEWFEQMVAESKRPRLSRGRVIKEWYCPPGVRNEAWDVTVYNLAIAYKLGLHKWSTLDWQRLRANLIPPTLDLFAPAPLAEPVSRQLQHLEEPEVVSAEPVTEVPSTAPESHVETVQTSVRSEPPPPVPPPPPPVPATSFPPMQPPAPPQRRFRSRGISQ